MGTVLWKAAGVLCVMVGAIAGVTVYESVVEEWRETKMRESFEAAQQAARAGGEA